MKVFFIILSYSTISIFAFLESSPKLIPYCDGSKPTYNKEIKEIINNSCATTGCHDSGEKKRDFTTYSSLKPFLENGSFEKRVLIKQNMPKKDPLSQEDINIFQCWADNDYLEE